MTMTKNEDLKKFSEFPVPTYEEWHEATVKSLRGKPFDTLLTKLLDDIVLDPMYQEKDIEETAIKAEQPGQYPFTRGISAERQSWLIGQELLGRTPKLVNDVLKHDLERGQNVYHLVLADELKAAQKPSGDSEFTGVPIFDREDVEEVFAGLDVSRYPLHIDAGEVSLPLLSSLQAIAKDEQLTGVVGADPLHQLAKVGKLSYSLDVAYDHLATATKWAKENAPKLRTVLVQTYAYHNGGASASAELATALSTGVAYVKALIDRGITADDAGKAIVFAFSVGSEFFTELTKIRVARTLWAAIMKEFGASEEGQKMVIHARTSAFTKTEKDTYTNLLRGTGEAFAAAAAGVQSLHVSALDEAIQEATAFSRRIARNTSLILQEESHIDKTVDPAGGSWYVEHLTDELAKTAWSYFQEIEQAGGIVAALENKLIQKWVNDAWEKRLSDVQSRKQVIVGVNQYVNLDEKIDYADRSADKKEAQSYFDSVKEKQAEVEGNEQKIETMDDCIALNEKNISLTAMHQLLGATAEGTATVEAIPARRLSEPFETLQKYSEEIGKDGASVYLLGLGKLAEYKPRMDFITGFFQSGGFTVKSGEGEEAIREASKASLVVLCGKDDAYAEQGEEIAKRLSEENKRQKRFIAGKLPEEQTANLKQAGIDDFIHVRTNVYTFLHDLQEWMKGGGK